MNVEDLKARVDALLARSGEPATGGDAVDAATEALQGTITIMQTVYGPNSPQEATLRAIATERRGPKPQTLAFHMMHVLRAVHGALANLKGELEAGIVSNLQ